VQKFVLMLVDYVT